MDAPTLAVPDPFDLLTRLRLVSAGMEQQVEANLERWLRASFSDRIEEKQALLRQAAEDHRIRSASTPPPTDVSDTEEPTRAFFGEESLPPQIVEVLPTSAEITGPRTRVRDVETVRFAVEAEHREHSLRDALEALDARLRQQPFIFGLAMLLLGITRGALVTYALLSPSLAPS